MANDSEELKLAKSFRFICDVNSKASICFYLESRINHKRQNAVLHYSTISVIITINYILTVKT